MKFDLMRRSAAEALGTFFLVMAVVGSGIMAEKLAGGNQAIALLCNTLPTGAVLFVIITIFVWVSGAAAPRRDRGGRRRSLCRGADRGGDVRADCHHSRLRTIQA